MEIKAYWISAGGGNGVSCRNEQELDKNVCFILLEKVIEDVEHQEGEILGC